MFAIRAPLSAIGGTLLSAAVFLGLARLVNVPFEMPDQIIGDPISSKPLRPDTPVQTKREPKIERPPQELRPDRPDLHIDKGTSRAQPIRYTRPPPVERASRGPRMRGFDGDVIPVVHTRPDYPPRALTGNIEGWVLVRFTVTPIGTVRDAVVVGSEPEGVFDDAALKAIARWRYNPRVENGEAVERVGLQYKFKFELEN